MNRRYFMVLLLTVLMMAAMILPACAQQAPGVPTQKASGALIPASPAPTSAAPTAAPKPTASPTATTAVKAKTIRFSYTQPKGASVAKGFEWWGPEFEKRTGGRYKVEIYPSSTLISLAAQLDSLKGGVCDIVMTSVGSFPKNFPLSGVASLPNLGYPLEKLEHFALAYQSCWDFMNTTPEIQAELKPYKLLLPLILDPYNLISKKKEIHSATDFKGLKVGGSGGKMEMVSSNGGAAVQQVPPQTYENMQKGYIDAAFVTMAQVSDYHLWDLADYYYLGDFGGGFILILMNWDAWNSMSPADQTIMMESWQAASKVSAEGSMENIEKGKKGTVAAGKKLTYPTEAEKADWLKYNDPCIEKWRKDAKSVGVDDKTLDKVFAAWTTIQKKYLAQMK